MRWYACVSVKPYLAAFVDGELGGAEVLRVMHHLDECGMCTDEVERMRAIGEALRAGGPVDDEPMSFDGLASAVLARRRADPDFSWAALLTRAQENHWLMIGGGSVVATLVSTVALSVILAFGPTPQRGDSFAALISNTDELAYAVPAGYEATLMQVDDIGRLATRASAEMEERVVRDAGTEADLVNALLAVVTDNGRPVSFERMDRNSRRQAEELLQKINRLRVSESVPLGVAVGVRQLHIRAFTSVSARN
jgi:hypothetical protein